MEHLSAFSIPYVGLSIGNHQFEYTIDKKFFNEFENSVIKEGRLEVKVSMQKQDTMLLFDFIMKGTAHVNCHRCTDDFELPVEGVNHLIIKIGDHNEEENEEVVMIDRHDHQINIAQFIYEYLSLLVPYQVVHPVDKNGKSTCNKKTIKKLEELSKPFHHHDDRWDVLKNLNLN